MTAAQSLIAIAIGLCTLVGFAAGLVRHLVKYYLAELRPDGNGGHNLRGRVDRIEAKVDNIMEILLSRQACRLLPSVISNVYPFSTSQAGLPNSGLALLSTNKGLTMDIEKVLVIVLITNVGWFVVGWSVGYKEGVKDGFSRGKAAGMRTARDIMVKVRGGLDV